MTAKELIERLMTCNPQASVNIAITKKGKLDTDVDISEVLEDGDIVDIFVDL